MKYYYKAYGRENGPDTLENIQRFAWVNDSNSGGKKAISGDTLVRAENSTGEWVKLREIEEVKGMVPPQKEKPKSTVDTKPEPKEKSSSLVPLNFEDQDLDIPKPAEMIYPILEKAAIDGARERMKVEKERFKVRNNSSNELPSFLILIGVVISLASWILPIICIFSLEEKILKVVCGIMLLINYFVGSSAHGSQMMVNEGTMSPTGMQNWDAINMIVKIIITVICICFIFI